MQPAALVVTLSLALAAPARAQAGPSDGGAAPLVPDGGADAASTPQRRDDKPALPVAEPRPAAAPRQRQQRLVIWHRALGFATLAALALTNILGTLDYYDKYDARGSDTGQLAPWHEGISIGTTAAFGATGILGLLTHVEPPRPRRLDVALLHKIAMALAAAGFAAQIVIGPITSISDGKLYQRDLALSHLVIGWTTFGFMGAGVLSYVF